MLWWYEEHPTRGSILRASLAGLGALYAGECIPALFDHFGHRGILDLAFHGDCVELRLDAACRPDASDTVLLAELRFEDGRHRKEAVTASCEFAQHGVVLELADHDGAQFLLLEPLIQSSTDGRVVSRKEHWHTVQRLGKSTTECFRQCRCCHPKDLARTHAMAVGANVETGGDGRIRQDDVNFVKCEVGDQALQSSFAA